MHTISNQSKNAGDVLSDLVGIIQNFNDSVNIYLQHIGGREILNPFQNSIQIDSMGINEPIPLEFFKRFGIRSLTLNAFHGKLALANQSCLEHNKKNMITGRWHNIRNDVIVEDLKMLFTNCPIIQFAEWASVHYATDFWEGLLDDVIKPLDKQDFQFIFYIGDTTKRLGFEVDEIIDIISEFSFYGDVTLVLDENEAERLWAVINGQDPDTNPYSSRSAWSREKYLSIFKAMDVKTLLVFCVDHTILFSSEQQFYFPGRTLNNNTTEFVKDSFNAGYQLGLLRQLEIPRCIALGLTVSGSYLRNESIPDKEDLVAYLKNWIVELETPIDSPKSELQNINIL